MKILMLVPLLFALAPVEAGATYRDYVHFEQVRERMSRYREEAARQKAESQPRAPSSEEARRASIPFPGRE